MADMGKNAAPLFIFIGPPGSGKGTLAKACSDRFKVAHLSTGDLCRRHIASQSAMGQKLQELINRGELVPDELIFSMVEQWLDENLTLDLPVVLDGYPRTQPQVMLLDAYLKRHQATGILEPIFFQISPEAIIERMKNRLVCSNNDCQAIYNRIVQAPKQDGICDVCGAELVVRADDAEDVVRERLAVYAKHEDSLKAAFDALRIPYVILPVANRAPIQVEQDFIARFPLIFKSEEGR